MASARSDSLKNAGHTAKDALTSGIQLSLGTDGVVVLAAAALVWFGLRTARR